ncbi:ECF transporter S component [Leuconostocaceae bacterium ESL0958]|nr:ECF transporter S component [Leuconostocaceae bacterium ESL0958]
MKHNSRQVTVVAVLAVLSFVLLIFPKLVIIPSASFLKLDFSIVPIVLALSWLGLPAAIAVLVLRTLLKLILMNEGVNTVIGMPVNFLVALAFICLLALGMGEKAALPRKLLAALLAILGMTLVAYVVNIVWAIPLYADFAHFDIAKYIGIKPYLWTMVVPFNLVEGLVWWVAAMLVVQLLAPFKKRLQS